MKKQVANEFAKIKDALNRYTVEVESVMTTYRRDLAQARQRAEAFKDSAGELERARAELVAPARAHIAAADQSLAKAASAVELDEREAERVAEGLNETNEKAAQKAAELRAKFIVR